MRHTGHKAPTSREPEISEEMDEDRLEEEPHMPPKQYAEGKYDERVNRAHSDSAWE